ncbi:MAG: metallophosphoesterase [Anaerovoracaceae bacterium]
MFTARRLKSVYEQAEKMDFDDNSKFVFMSDIHRGDNSVGDEFAQNRIIYYHALQYYYQDGFTYIENGDGDELWEIPYYKYIRSAHPDIFDLLRQFQKEDRLIMLYGNHNVQIKNKEFVKRHMTREYDDYLGAEVEILPGIEAHAALRMRHTETAQEIFVIHGHQGELFNDYLWPITLFMCRYVWRFLHRLGFQYAASPARNRFKRAHTEKTLNRWVRDKNVLLICGHTHRPRLPQPGDGKYFNCGCCIHPHGITCIEMSYGEIALVNWMAHTRPDGMMYIKRTLVKGPEELRSYMKSDDEVTLEKKQI